MHGFRLFLAVSCLVLAGASWFAPVASSTRIAATAAGTLAALLLAFALLLALSMVVGRRPTAFEVEPLAATIPPSTPTGAA